MTCWMLSSSAIDPTLYVASDDRSKSVDAETRMSSYITAAAEMAYEDAGAPKSLWCHWSSDERLDEGIGGDKRFVPLWLPERHLLGISWQSWYDGRLPSPTFPSDYLDELSHDLWTLSPSSLLINDDDDDYGNRTWLTRLEEKSVCESYCCHDTKTTNADESWPNSRCLSHDSPSVDAYSPIITSNDGAKLAASTSGSRASSRSNSLDHEDHEPPARMWKRRRRRRHRRWSRQSSLSRTSRAHHLSLDCSVYRDAHILRSLLLHGGYAHKTAAKSGRRSGSSGSGVVRRVVSGCHRHGFGGSAVPQQLTRTVSTPISRRQSSAAGDNATTAAILRRCLEDHCYFNWKQAAVIDSNRTIRCDDTRRNAWSTSVSWQYDIPRHWRLSLHCYRRKIRSRSLLRF